MPVNLKKVKFGIIGQGFVGTAIREGFKAILPLSDVRTFDIAKEEASTEQSAHDVFDACDIVFVCVPTPMRKSGECDTRIVEGVLRDANDYAGSQDRNVPLTLVVKSTIPPGSTVRWNEMFESIDVVFSPEFLTEANANDDFIHQNRIIVGGPENARARVKELFKAYSDGQGYAGIDPAQVLGTDSTTAEMVKYVANCFLATKVSFFNEVSQIASTVGVDYGSLVRLVTRDPRIGDSHCSVPGPDGHPGFGGSCLPKDLNALIRIAEDAGVDPKMLQAVWEKNLQVRPSTARDWEAMKGRAVSED